MFYRVIKKNKQVVMYLIYGVLTTMVSILSYFLLTTLFLNKENTIQLQIANMLSWLISVLFAYTTNKKFVFCSKAKGSLELGKFILSRIVTLIVDMVLMHLLVTNAGKNDLLAKTATQVIVIFLNYILGKLFVFREETHK